METPQAKLRNVLTPAYSLADMILGLEGESGEKREGLLEIVIEQAKRVEHNRERIDELLKEIDKL